MITRMKYNLFSQFVAAALAVTSIAAHAGLREANEAMAAKDYATALKEFEPLAAKGDANAQFQLGEMYNNGIGLPRDEKMAVSWYLKSAEQGYAEAQNMLGIMYENGAGVTLDYKKAASWYRKAAEQGAAEAQSALGALYVNGSGVPVSLVQALKWFTLAASTGYEIGQQNVKEIEPKMSKKQIEEARALVLQWQKSHGKQRL